MIFTNLSATVQAIVLKDFISYSQACKGIQYSIDEALFILRNDLSTCYDSKDGRIE
jgi:hypothetical protein